MRFNFSIFLLLSSFTYCFSQAALPDSILFNKLKAEFNQFEQEHGHYIETKNGRMHYLTWGMPTGKSLVWIHGSYSNAYEFYQFADSFARDGYFVIAIDYFGHGLTPFPKGPYTIHHVADDIRFLLDHLKIRKTVVGGWSRGGSIATAFYNAYPSYVSGIVLEDGGSVAWAKMDHRESIEEMSAKLKNVFREDEKESGTGFSSQLQAVDQVTNLENKGRVFYALASVRELADGKWQHNPGVTEQLGEASVESFLNIFYRPFSSPHAFGVSTLLLDPFVVYRNLDVPLLILDPVSDNDRFSFEEENKKIKEQHPALVTHKIYNNTSHGLKFQRPGEFLKDVRTFLDSIQ